MNVEDIVKDLVEVELPSDEDFLKVKETLTRIGISSDKNKALYQTCHILHKRGKYYIVHFKELFMLDGNPSTFNEKDMGRRNTIANLLEQWGLLKIAENSIQKVQDPVLPLNSIKILQYSEKGDWNLVPKYNIGSKKTQKTA